jgi:crotonobetaine/carnitine-CoA ligase
VTRFADINSTPFDERTLPAVLGRAIDHVPDKTALVDAGKSLSYGELWQAARKLAAGFLALGIGRNDKVLMLMDNHVDNVLTWTALTLIGAVEVPVNTAYKGEMLAYVVNDSGAEVIVVDASHVGRLSSVVDELKSLKTVIVRTTAETDVGPDVPSRLPHPLAFAEVADHHTLADPAEIDPWDLAAVIYTSGTTGRSKGVLAPHAHAWNHASMVGSTEANDTRYVVLPQFHIAGQWGGVYRALIAEATAYVADAFHVSSFWDDIHRVGATTTQLVGTMASFLYAQPPRPSDVDNTLREIHMIPLFPDVTAFAERFGVSVATGFGNTEIGTVLISSDAVFGDGLRARDGYAVKLVDDNDIEVPVGRIGELVTQAELPWTTMLGYLGDPDKTAKAYRNGWLHSGDALYQDRDGSFHFADRMDDAIRRRGENVSSQEVETHVNQHPAVLESAVVAVPSEHLEDEIKAVVVLREGETADEESIYRFLAERLPYFMVPRFIELAKDLPKTPTAKIRKFELRTGGTELAWDSYAAGLISRRDT